MSENVQKPRIRFKGFSDAWEQRKFSQLVLIERGGSPRPIDDFITESTDGLNWVKIGDAPSQGRYITKTAEKIKPSGLSKTREVHPGDLILSNSMSFGKPYIMGINGCIHDGWLLIRDVDDRFDLKFLCHLLGSEQMLNQYRSLAAGSTVNNLNKELVGSTVVSVPKIEEQKFLGEFFESIDNLITLHQRKYDKLVAVKKALLEKMFPADGETVPKIRFKGFSDAWEQRKLGEVFETVTDYVAAGSFADLAENVVYRDTPNYAQLVRTTDLKNGFYSGSSVYVDKKAFDFLYRVNLDKECIILPNIGNCGEVYLVIPDDLPYKHNVLGPNAILVRSDTSDNAFLSILLQGKDFQEKLSLIISPNGQTKFNKTELKQISLNMPKQSDEQHQLGAYFKQLDHLITLHQRQLEKLKNIKSALLEKMFV